MVIALRHPVLAPLLALALAGCRSFPVGLYVPDSTLEALSRPEYEEHLGRRRLERELRASFGYRGGPREPSAETYFRLDLDPPLGPLSASACARAGAPAVRGLRPGDLVLAKNPRAQSLGTTLTFEPFTFYDHLGVLAERSGALVVCESWPRFHPFGSAPDFASRFRGGVRARPLPAFLQRYETLEFVRLPDEMRNAALARAALSSLDEGLEYDPHHDPEDPSLSCSEYLLHLLERAGYQPPSGPRPVSPDPSLRQLLASLGFARDAYYVPEQFAELPGARTVGTISRHSTRAGVLAQRCAFELLHEHFAAHSRVSSYLAIQRFTLLRYRDNVRLFLGYALGYSRERGLTDPEELRGELGRMLPLFFRPRAAE